MTAEEIRNKKTWECYGQPYESPIQVEIAAQLAENQDSRKPKPATEQQGYWLDWPGGRVNPDWKGWQGEPVKAKARKKGEK